MPIRKYANATPPGGDTDMSDSTDMSVQTSPYSDLATTIKIDKDSKTCLTSQTSNAADVLKQTLTRMSPAYKAGKARRQADPLAWRTEKIIRKLRPVLSKDNFLEVAEHLSLADPIERAATVQRLEEWWEAVHGRGNT